MGFDRSRATEVVRQTLETLSQKRIREFTAPTIRWDLKGKSCLGQAVGGSVIRLHPEAADLLGDAYVETIVHEACHIAQEQERRSLFAPKTGQYSAHGAVWRTMMRQVGASPDRVARLPEGVTLTPARTVERFVVECGCRQHVVSKVRANRLARYHCKGCGGSLRLVGRAS